MLRVGSVVLNVSDMSRAAEFWSRALGYGVRGGVVREDESAVLVIAGEGPVTLDEDDRMHLDLYVDSEEDLAEQVARLVDLGAQRVAWAYPDDAHFVVLADTEGNLFCVVNVGWGRTRKASHRTTNVVVLGSGSAAS